MRSLPTRALIALFMAAPFLDELYSGAPTIGAPAIRADFSLGFVSLAAILLSIPAVLALVVEAPLLLLASRLGTRTVASVSALLYGVGAIGAGLVQSAWAFTACLTIAATAGGVVLALAQGAGVPPGDEARWMTRWTLSASLGDLLAPVLIAALAAAALGWRTAFFVFGAALLVLVPLSIAGLKNRAVDDEEEPPLKEELKEAAKNPRLLWWSLGVLSCDLLDEIFVIVGVLYLKEVRGLDDAQVPLAMAGCFFAHAVGLLITERLLAEVSSRVILLVALPLASASLFAFVFAPGPIALVGLTALGLFDAPCYPLAKARAYQSAPRADLVNAVERALSPAAVIFPIGALALAEFVSLEVALLSLGSQLALVFVLAMWVKPRPRT